MQNKAPQGKQDPIPTPELELEQYGVWVKAEPQDVVDEPLTGASTVKTKTKDEPVPILLSEEEELIDSFEFDEKLVDDFEELEALSPVDEFETIGDLPEELDAFDLEALEPAGFESRTEPLSSDLGEDNSEANALDISLDELDYEEPPEDSQSASSESVKTSEDAFDTTDIDIEDFGFSDESSSDAVSSLDDFGAIESASEKRDAADIQGAATSDDFEALDIDLQFDDTIPSDDSMEIAEAYASADDAIPDVTSDFESIDIDSIGLDSASNESTAPTVAPLATMKTEFETGETGISMDSFIDMDNNDAPGIIPDMEMENVALNDEPIGFDDVQAVSDDLSLKTSEPSADLLQKIVLELSSIKEELVSLRGQLSSLKAGNQELPFIETEPEATEESTPGGFFDEEDDDTIALTGDELDNILNTADFTEEVADNESLDGFVAPSFDIPDDIELLPEDGIYETQEPGIETIDLPTITPTEDEFEAISSQDGVTPITNVPEDTSFLDASDDEVNLEFEMPLEEIPLVEPDASDLDSIIDSAFDVEEDEFASLEAPAEEHESEIVLDFDSDDEPVISTVDSFPEPLEEIEDALELEDFVEQEDLGGLELLAEESELEELEELSLDEENPFGMIEDSGLVEASAEDLHASLSSVAIDSNEPLAPVDDSLFVETVPATDEFQEMEPYVEPELAPLENEAFEQSAAIFETESEEVAAEPSAEPEDTTSEKMVPDKLQHDVKSVLLYLDQLLASLPEEKIEEFASSEYYDTYKRLFDDLGLL
ncbi:MAG: hypothetical protein A2Z96_01960 [Spirochaetes bacterium GWB1_48_6]|nr:MAG: hypothetical protein A2Z96_01960 [Spirochaetes bacterium GWB1_48_6]